jgi:hypothetical protein
MVWRHLCFKSPAPPLPVLIEQLHQKCEVIPKAAAEGAVEEVPFKRLYCSHRVYFLKPAVNGTVRGQAANDGEVPVTGGKGSCAGLGFPRLRKNLIRYVHRVVNWVLTST